MAELNTSVMDMDIMHAYKPGRRNKHFPLVNVRKLAELCGFRTTQSMSNILNGKRECSVANLRIMSQAMGCSMEELAVRLDEIRRDVHKGEHRRSGHVDSTKRVC